MSSGADAHRPQTVVAMKQMSIVQLKEIFGDRSIAGTPEQIDVFAMRVAELAAMNGQAWVRDNAQRLLDQWHCAIGHRTNCNDAVD